MGVGGADLELADALEVRFDLVVGLTGVDSVVDLLGVVGVIGFSSLESENLLLRLVDL
jgi:hypothetical protein